MQKIKDANGKGFTLVIFTGAELKKKRRKQKSRIKKAEDIAAEHAYGLGRQDANRDRYDELAAALYTALVKEPGQVNGSLVVEKSLVGQVALILDVTNDKVTYRVNLKSMMP